VTAAPPKLARDAFREDVRPEDAAAVRALAAATGFFSESEADIAEELVLERLRLGEAGGYFFLFADAGDGPAEYALAGYACYGPTPGTNGCFDLYWIVVAPDGQGRGLGRGLLAAAEDRIRERGGRKVIVETSSRPLYAKTRAFYDKTGYLAEAVIADFYDAGDAKIIFTKTLG